MFLVPAMVVGTHKALRKLRPLDVGSTRAEPPDPASGTADSGTESPAGEAGSAPGSDADR